jgi:hypothetical protein
MRPGHSPAKPGPRSVPARQSRTSQECTLGAPKKRAARSGTKSAGLPIATRVLRAWLSPAGLRGRGARSR